MYVDMYTHYTIKLVSEAVSTTSLLLLSSLGPSIHGKSDREQTIALQSPSNHNCLVCSSCRPRTRTLCLLGDNIIH